MNHQTNHLSRRRFLSLSAATGAAVAAGLAFRPRDAAASTQVPSRRARLASDASSQFRAVAEAVANSMQRTGTPGAALAVYGNGREEIATFGVSNLASMAPVLETTRFQHGSLSKTYTATAAMVLREDGRLNIDAPVRAYLPGFKLSDEYTAEHVTVRHLLTHTSGWWGDAFIDTGDDDHALARFVAEQLPRFQQIAPLGAHINYSNAAVALLGRVIEVITGRTYRQAMQELVLGPLGLGATHDPRVALKQPHATGYGMADGKIVETAPLLMPRHADPSGGLWTDIRDQISYARFHLGEAKRGSSLLSGDAIAEMQTVLKTMPETGAQVGWNWFIEHAEGVRLVRHNGSTFGQMATLVLAPDHSFAVTVLANSLTSEPLLKAAEQAALAEYLGVSETGPSYTAQAMTTDELKQYTGTYSTPVNAAPVTLRDGQLFLRLESRQFPGQITPSAPLELPDVPVSFVGPDQAVLGSPEEPFLPISFVRKPDGTVGWLAFSDRVVPKVT